MDSGYLLAEVVFGGDGEVVDIEYLEENPAAARMVGFSLIGKRLREISRDYEQYWYDIWGRVAKSGVGEHLERYASPEGRWYDFHVFKPEPKNADSRQVAVVFQDVSVRKASEDALRTSEARLRAVLQQAPLAIVFTGCAGEILFRNTMFDKLWGRPAHVTTAETYSTVYDGYHMDGRPIASSEWPGARAVLKGETVRDEVLEIVHASGRRTPCAFDAGPIRDDDGAITGGVVMFRDLTDERKVQRALSDSEAKYRNLFESMRQGYVEMELVRDDDGRAVDYRMLLVNPQYERLTGIAAGEAIGRTGRALVADLDPAWLETFERIVRSGEPEHFEREALGRWFEVQAYPLGGDRFAALFDDVSERKRAEAALRESEERQAFLLKLSDAMRSSRDAEAIVAATSRMLGERLGASHVIFAEIDEAAGVAHLSREWKAEGVAAHPMTLRLADFGGPLLADLNAGHPVRFDDVGEPPYARPDLAALAAMGIRAGLSVPLMVDGRFVVNLNVHQDRPRRWTDDEVALTREVAERLWASLQRARAERSLREREEQQAFLLKLSDTLRPMSDATAIQEAASRMLGEHLDVDRASYAEFAADLGSVSTVGGYCRPGVASVDGVYGIEAFADFTAALLKGEVAVARDASAQYAAGSDTFENMLGQLGIRAAIASPLVKGEKLVAAVYIHSIPARDWTEAEIALVGLVGERTWEAVERARAEAALRESELQQRLTLDLVPALLWWADPIGETVALNDRWKAYTGQTGTETQDFGWLDAIHPDDLAATTEAFHHAFQTGEPLERQQRIHKAGDGYRWHLVRHAPVRDGAGAIARWFGAAVDIDELHRLQERQGVLLHELQHRVRNTLAVVRSIVARTGETSPDVEHFSMHLQGRLNALARTQVVLTRAPGEGVDLETLVREELLTQAARETQVEVAGPEVLVSAKVAEVLALAIHELATNAVKYGALSVAGGCVRVGWQVDAGRAPPWLRLDWRESGARVLGAAPRREGFGTELITTRVPYELRGRGALEFLPGGVRCQLEFPLRPGDSILQTHAPPEREEETG
ncbi:MAG: PAS domain S-box protein [Caulobacteraceae bacterium]|nr:PAS domain S-box protein [Caulobacter sp.]